VPQIDEIAVVFEFQDRQIVRSVIGRPWLLTDVNTFRWIYRKNGRDSSGLSPAWDLNALLLASSGYFTRTRLWN
jgi:hypothetical protein